MRRSRERGFTLVEILVSLGLAAVVSAAVLLLARGQLTAHAMNDEIMRAQANARAGVDFVETMLRRSCGGLSTGQVGINVNGAPQVITSCVRVWDGANVSNGTFTTGTVGSQADAVEVVYPTSQPTSIMNGTPATDLSSANPSAWVADVNGLNVNDLALVTDVGGTGGALFKIATITSGAVAPGQTNTPGRLTFTPLSGNVVTPVAIGVGAILFRAASVALYLQPPAANNPASYGSVMFDPDGMAGGGHDDAEPLIDGVDDLQFSVGIDADLNGQITETIPTSSGGDEVWGNASGELPLPTAPWNGSGQPQLRTLRATLLVRTTNTYPGAALANTTLNFEDRVTYPSTSAAPPRYRPERIVVAPRAWSLTN